VSNHNWVYTPSSVVLLVLAQVLSCSLLGLEYGHKKRVWQMSAICLGIANEVETAGS
jgi:hypothetical protein